MSLIANKAAGIRGPVSKASTTGMNGVFALTGSTTSTNFIVPASMVGRYCTFLVTGSNAQISFATSSMTLTYDAYSTVSANGTITSSAARGFTLTNGVSEHFVVPKVGRTENTTVYAAYIMQNSSGSLTFYMSEAQGPDLV